jgi:NADH-quinone oxidoreductase subunit L
LNEVIGQVGAGVAAAAEGGGAGVGPWWVSLIPLMPIVGVVLCTLTAIFRVKSKLPAFLSVGCLAVSFILTVQMYLGLSGHGGATVTTAFEWIRFSWGVGPGKSFIADFGFYIDSLTCLWMLFVTGLGTLIALYASEYMSGDVGVSYSRFFAAFNLFVFSMSCLVMADNLVLLYLGWEGVGLCSYLLIGYFYKKPSAVEAAKKAFIVNRIGDLGLAMGVFLTFVQFGTVEYRHLLPMVEPYIALARDGHFEQIPFYIQLIPVLLMVGAFGKSAQFPLYVWLPDAMEGPTPVSALIHAATMVTAGIFLICRTYWLFVCSEWALPTVAWVGGITALLAATIGMAQFDIKRIMAYSTVSQLGYMFCGLGVLTSAGAASHVLTHAFFKALLFLACGAVMHGFAGQLDLRKLSGLRRVPGWSIVSLTMLIGCLSLAGFPGLGGYFSKDMILAETFVTPGYAALGWVLLFTAGLTAYYTFRVFFRVFVGPVEFEPGDEVHGHDGHDDHDHGAGHGGHGHGAPSHSAEAHAKHDFHPHAPGWAINSVLVILAVLSVASAGLFFVNTDHHGWVGGMIHGSSAHFETPYAHHEGAPGGEPHAAGEHGAEPGTFLGLDPHVAMYFVSAFVGLVGIGVAWVLHYQGRTTAARAKADDLLPRMQPWATWAQNKWYVDEFYDSVFRTPLWVLSNIFHLIDKLLVDGLVNLAGWLPSAIGSRVRPAQNGLLHSYALGMAGGLALILLVVWLRMM